jgi:hypothetical protein
MSKTSVTACDPTDSQDNTRTKSTILKQVAEVVLMFTVKSKTDKGFEME